MAPDHNDGCIVLSLRPPNAGGRCGNCLQPSLSVVGLDVREGLLVDRRAAGAGALDELLR